MITGITRVRNEEKIIRDTLDYYSRYCNSIYVYDDASTDLTADICRNHPIVAGVIVNKKWDSNRLNAEYKSRQAVLELAQKDNPKWLMYFDADERVDFNLREFEKNENKWDAVRMKLFDFYITEEDKHLPYYCREWLGPEYREIIMLFRNVPGIGYFTPDQRIVTLNKGARVLDDGYVKHYGKAISEEEWEQTCLYYMHHFPEPYKSKWAQRRGKAIHKDMSDFNRPLIKWDSCSSKGVKIG